MPAPLTNIRVQMTGLYRKGEFIIGRVERALEQGGRKDLVAQFKREANAGDYDELLWTVDKYVHTY